MAERKIRKKLNVSLIVLCVILALYTIILFIPMFWALLTAFRNHQFYQVATSRKNVGLMLWGLDFTGSLATDFKAMMDLFVKAWTFDNFKLTFTEFYLPVGDGEVYVTEMFFNSVLYAGGCAIIATIVPCVMAYLVARYPFFLGKIIYGIVLVTMAIPIVGSLPSEIKMVENLGLMDSVIGLYVLKANFLGLYFLVFYAQFKSIPKDYTEAAEMDGASDWHVMLRIIFPIATGTITTVILLNFIAFWNDYQIPMIYWKTRPVVAYGMYVFVSFTTGQQGLGSTPVKLSAMIVVAVPIIILFLFFNQKIMSNMSIGGVKG